MNRRFFIRSIGGAVAAAMLPFARPLELNIEGRWIGIKEQLRMCDRFKGNVEPLDLRKMMDLMYELKKLRESKSTAQEFRDFYVRIDA